MKPLFQAFLSLCLLFFLSIKCTAQIMAVSSKKTAGFIHQTHSTPVQNDVTIVGTIIGCKIYLIDFTNNVLKAIVLVERSEPINLRVSLLNPGQYIIQVQFPSGGIFEIQFEKINMLKMTPYN